MRPLGVACFSGIVGCLGLLLAAAAADEVPRNPGPSQGVVFISTGTDYSAAAPNLTDVLQHAGVPLSVQEAYCGAANILTDGRNQGKHREAGGQLARRIRGLRASNPQQRIYLVGYSEGAGVMLAAAEALPPGSVDRIILVAPAVSCRHDLRPALLAAREGIDCFFNTEDNYQELVGDLLKTPQDWRAWHAGRIGFCPMISPWQDAQLYRNLRQHRWTQNMEQVVGVGGHFGFSRVRFLQSYLLPLLGQPQ